MTDAAYEMLLCTVPTQVVCRSCKSVRRQCVEQCARGNDAMTKEVLGWQQPAMTTGAAAELEADVLTNLKGPGHNPRNICVQ